MSRVFGVFSLLWALASAQTFNARITGTIKDATDAVVPGATVTAIEVSTRVRKTAVSEASGVYNIPLLLPGTYEVTVELAGFQTQVRRDVRLEVNQTATLDFQLAPSQVASRVEVTAEIPLLQSETSSVGATLENKLITQFPLIQRDIMGLLRSIPGVISASQVGDARGGRNVFNSNFSVAGGRTSTNEVLLDGAPNTIGDFNGVAIVPPQDSVQEFRVETSTYSAEFGRSGGGAVNIVTKNGTNDFRGTVNYYHQNDAFNANSFTNNRNRLAKPIVRRHQYGMTFGGPVLVPRLYNGKNKTFFFTSFEGRRENDPIGPSLFSSPTERERAGDFSQTVAVINNQPQVIRIFDPATSRIVGGVRTRDPFPGNIIPGSRIHPVARRVLQDYPLGNIEGNPVTNRQNYFFRDVLRFSRDLFSTRIDQFFSEKHRLFGRFNIQENLQAFPGKIVRFADTTSVRDTFRNVGLDDTYQITSRLSNVFRLSWARFRANQFPKATLGFDPTTLGLPSYLRDNAAVLFYPNFSFGFTDMGGRAYNNQPRDTYGAQEQMVYVKGGHNMRFGGEWRIYKFYPFQIFNPTGAFSFGASFTQQDHQAATRPNEGFGLASFLLGVGSFSFERVEPLSAYSHYYGVYFQDDWKITPRLTLNLGLRWETETGTAESHNRLTYFDAQAQNPLVNRPGAIFFTGGGKPRSVRDPNFRNFGPRLGFAYRLNNKSVVRGGYGIFYLPIGLETGVVSTPFDFNIPAVSVNPDFTPRTTLSDPFGGGLNLTVNRITDGTYLTGSFPSRGTVVRRVPAGYIQQWNFALSRQLGRSNVVDATYFGSRGVKLPLPSVQLNQIHPDNLARGGAFLNERVPNPFLGQITTGPLAQPTVFRMQLLKPYPHYATPSLTDAYGGSLLANRYPAGDSIFHAATFKFERRFSAGLSVSAHYTISKLIDIGGVGNGNAFNDPSALRDIYNIRLERSVSRWDVPQRLIITYAYELPFGKGKRLLNRGGLLDYLVGGWTLFGFHTYESGRPIDIGGPNLSRLGGAEPSRASVVAGQQPKLPLAQSRANARDFDPICFCTKPWFNTAAFTVTPEFVIPNGPRFLPNVRQDTTKNWDLSVDKNVRLKERWTLILQGRFFNALNQVYFAGPVTAVNSAVFGSTTAVNSAPRRIEVGAKIAF
ncbi:MAG: TonB-dependent receptor [Bryobacteraceae bacterium]|nr:TonB-dependent receptor [Bryobacteraceae bacterium]MDW8379149.1 carboxypeptidase regulatory-like domain-containing protein [Bryobacterales bacterium]